MSEGIEDLIKLGKGTEVHSNILSSAIILHDKFGIEKARDYINYWNDALSFIGESFPCEVLPRHHIV
jgi:hypothetical protein